MTTKVQQETDGTNSQHVAPGRELDALHAELSLVKTGTDRKKENSTNLNNLPFLGSEQAVPAAHFVSTPSESSPNRSSPTNVDSVCAWKVANGRNENETHSRNIMALDCSPQQREDPATTRPLTKAAHILHASTPLYDQSPSTSPDMSHHERHGNAMHVELVPEEAVSTANDMPSVGITNPEDQYRSSKKCGNINDTRLQTPRGVVQSSGKSGILQDGHGEEILAGPENVCPTNRQSRVCLCGTASPYRKKSSFSESAAGLAFAPSENGVEMETKCGSSNSHCRKAHYYGPSETAQDPEVLIEGTILLKGRSGPGVSTTGAVGAVCVYLFTEQVDIFAARSSLISGESTCSAATNLMSRS